MIATAPAVTQAPLAAGGKDRSTPKSAPVAFTTPPDTRWLILMCSRDGYVCRLSSPSRFAPGSPPNSIKLWSNRPYEIVSYDSKTDAQASAGEPARDRMAAPQLNKIDAPRGTQRRVAASGQRRTNGAAAGQGGFHLHRGVQSHLPWHWHHGLPREREHMLQLEPPRLYDRREDRVTLDEVVKINILG